MSRVSRSVPRSSDSTSSSRCSGGMVFKPFAQQLDRGELRGERRAEFVRDVGEHGVARAAHALELGLVAHHLHLQAVDHAGAGDHGLRDRRARVCSCSIDLRAAAMARAQDRAVGSRRAAVPSSAHGLSTSPQNLPMASSGFDAEQPRRLRIQVADVAFLVDGVHALDHCLEHRLRLGLAMAQLGSEIDEVAAHVVHGARELRRLRPGRAVGIEVEKSPCPRRTAASVSASIGRGDALAEHHAGEHREHREARRR